jgi:hypothetical protein
METVECGNKWKSENVTENSLLEYLLFSVCIILLHTIPPGICLRRNIPVTKEI